jgi:autophagy-related protein 5
MSGSSLRAQGPSRQPSLVSTSSAVAASAATQSASSSAQRLRRLIWDATIPLVISIECDDIPNVSLDRSVETHYVKAPRISYLPLVLQQVKSDLLALMMDDTSLRSIKDDDYCFYYEGTPLRWWVFNLEYRMFHCLTIALSTGTGLSVCYTIIILPTLVPRHIAPALHLSHR